MLSLVLWILGTAALCLLAAGVYYWHIVPKGQIQGFQRQGIKGFPYSLLGELPELDKYEAQDKYLDFYTDAARKYGFTFTMAYGPVAVLTVNDPALVKEVLVTHRDDYVKSTEQMKDALRPLLGDGLLISEGNFWKRQRKCLARHFHFHNLKSMVSLINDESLKSVEDMRSRLDAMRSRGEPAQLEMHGEVAKMTMNIIAVASFGPTFLQDEKVNRVVRHAFGQVLHDLQERAFSGVSLLPVVKDVPTPSLRRVQRGCHAIRAEVEKVIQDRIRGENKALLGRDLLDILLEAVNDPDPEKRMSMDAAVDEAVTFVFAAFETTANMFAWLLVNLSQHPEVWDRCLEEVRSVVGDRDPELDDLRNLKVCDAAISETLRLWPPGPMLSKYAIRDHKIGDIHVPAGSTVTVNALLLHRHPDFWKDPEKFDIERFLDPSNVIHPYSYAPFSQGSRTCLGKNFAMIESKIILIYLMRNFRLRLVPGQKIVATLDKLNLVPKYGTMFYVDDIRSKAEANGAGAAGTSGV